MDSPFAPLVPEVISIAGRRVEVFDVGASVDDDPIVVLLTGAGDTARSWLPVQATLSRDLRVISYERSGVGRSAPGSPRTLGGFVAELSALVDALAPTRRVLLVGHSFGALVARVYTSRHPDRVAGLVMLDATPDLLGSDRLRRVGYRLYVESIAAARRVLPRTLFAGLVRRNALPYYPGRGRFLTALDDRAREEWHRAVTALFLGAAVGEMRAVLPGAAEAAAEFDAGATSGGGHLGDLPVALLTSGTYGRGWIAMHDAVAHRYPNATHRLSGDRFHNVHMRHVEITVETVRTVLAAGRMRRDARGHSDGSRLSPYPRGDPMTLPDSLLDLLRKPSPCFLSTIMPDGSPQVTETWVGTDGEHVVINTVEGFVKVRNVERDPRVAVAIQDPEDPFRYIQVRGKVVGMTTEGGAESIEALSQKYTGQAYPWYGGRDQKRVILTISAESVSGQG